MVFPDSALPRPAGRSGPIIRVVSALRTSIAVLTGVLLLAGCRTVPQPVVPIGQEFIVAGQYYPAGTRVVTWHELGGYNAYAYKAPVAGTDSPKNHGHRRAAGVPVETVPAAPLEAAALREVVDQFVLHYDMIGLSGPCFDILQRRGLSVHFLLDVDGTIYQTLDLQERAYHATLANSRSIGIEIANLGAYPIGEKNPFAAWYQPDETGAPYLTLPAQVAAPRIRTPDFIGRPTRREPVVGKVQGRELVQYDFTPEQYAALIKLTAALHRIFPKLKLDYPRDSAGEPLTAKMPAEAWATFGGVIGHFHLQENKVDPGPAMQWDKLIEGARRLVE